MANYYNSSTLIYLDGKLVKASEAGIDLYSQSLHYGYAVFEGIRSYANVDGETKIFKAEEHFLRLEKSAKALNMPYNYTVDELIAATYEVLKLNNQQNAYIRPLVFAPANMSFGQNNISHLTIQTWEMQPFLGDKLLRIMTSSFQRPNPKGFHIEAKASGHYVNSILASQEAKSKGFDEALLTDMNGFIAEGPGANVFFQKGNTLITPAKGNILPGITRATIIEIAKENNIQVEEREVKPSEINQFESAFFCGTAAEVIGWESLDNYTFPLNWEDSIGRTLQVLYKDLVTEKLLQTIN